MAKKLAKAKVMSRTLTCTVLAPEHAAATYVASGSAVTTVQALAQCPGSTSATAQDGLEAISAQGPVDSAEGASKGALSAQLSPKVTIEDIESLRSRLTSG